MSLSKSQRNRNRLTVKAAACVGAYLLILSNDVIAKTYDQAEIIKVSHPGQVFIDGRKAKPRNIAPIGSTVLTKESTADILFDSRTRGIMDVRTPIRMGTTCIELQPPGRVLLSGPKCAAIGPTKASRARSTYELARDIDGSYTLSVLAGEVVVEDQPPSSLGDLEKDQAEDTNLAAYSYPKINPYIGTGISGDTYTYPSTGGLILGQVNGFVPLSQSESSRILYSYTSASSNFDGYWGVSTEIGYRWFTPSNQSSSGLYLGVSGFDTPSCFNTLMNLGAGYEVSRWRFGASTGLKVAGCDAGFSYAGLNVSLPIAKMAEQRTLYLSLSPYVIWGSNIISPGSIYQSGDSSSISPGAKISLNVPLSKAFTIKAYSAVDTVYGVSIGSSVVYRIPTRRRFIDDPNTDHAPMSSSPLPSSSPIPDIPGAGALNPPMNGGNNLGSQPPKHPNQVPYGLVVSNDELNGLITQASIPDSPIVVKEGQQAKFTADGELIGSIVDMKPMEIGEMMLRSLKGHALLPESRRLAKVASRYGVLTTQLAQITGLYFLESAALPVSETVDAPFGTSRFPTAAYSCVATEEGKRYAEKKLLEDGNDDAANQIRNTGVAYLGKGDKVANGWPVTAFNSNAYVFGNGATCETINSIIRGSSGYDGPPNPLRKVDFK